MNWLIPFIIGLVIGQETDIPRVRPYLEMGIKKLIQMGKEFSEDVDKRSVTDTSNLTDSTDKQEKMEKRKNWWRD